MVAPPLKTDWLFFYFEEWSEQTGTWEELGQMQIRVIAHCIIMFDI